MATPSAFKAAYGLQETTPGGPALTGSIYSQVKDRLEMKNVQALSSRNSIIYIIEIKEKGKFYATRITRNGMFDEVLYSSKMQDDNNGTIGVLKIGEALSIEFRDDKRNIREMSHKEYQATLQRWTPWTNFALVAHQLHSVIVSPGIRRILQ